jgi:hypothetical protein
VKTLMIIAALLVSGCGKKKNSQEGMDPGTGSSAMGSSNGSAPAMGSGSAAGSGSSAAMGSGSAAAATAAVDVPTETDFEADAKSKITDKNVDAELTSLEKDLAQ